MRADIFAVAIVLILLSVVGSAQGDKPLAVMSFNIRYDNPGDGENAWQFRKEEVANLIRELGPDILGLQEVLAHQLQDLLGLLTGYEGVGVGRDDGRSKGEYSPVLYRSDRFTLLGHQTVWLSQTGDTASVGWDAALPRICTYVRLRDQTSGDTIHVFNTHFDHIGRVAREMSAELIQFKVDEWVPDGQSMIVMGDLNDPPTARSIALLKNRLLDPYDDLGLPEGDPAGTFNGWIEDLEGRQRIDYIFYSGLTPKVFRHLSDRRANGRFLSDHFPVFVVFE